MSENQPETRTELNADLGNTPEQVRQELRARGIDPAAGVEAMRRIGRTMAAKYGDAIQRERILASPLAKAFPRFDQPVAAGSPEWIGAAEPPSRVSALSLLGDADPASSMLVEVSGWSMKDIGIADGDAVLVDVKAQAKDGDIVVAHIEGEGQVVKRARFKAGNEIVLESANPDFPPRSFPADAIRIHGVVRGRIGKV